MTFIPNTFDCFSDNTVNFFHSASFGNASFTSSWATRNTPYNEGLTPVYLLVLQKFNIPISFSHGVPGGGELPGVNIKRMSAIEAIRLSLAEDLLSGKWWDVVEDGLGGITVVDTLGAPPTADLDVRACFPTSSITNKVDMVIVRGYDPPPLVEVGGFKDVVPAGTGPINPESISGDEKLFTVSPGDLLSATRHGPLASNTVYKSYLDPVFGTGFQSQEEAPFFDVGAFEEVLGFVVDIDGMGDEESSTQVQYSFSDTTTWFEKLAVPNFTGDVIYSSEVTVSTPTYSDRYGSPWPLMIRPSIMAFVGDRVKDIEQLPIPSIQAFYNVALGALTEFPQMSEGANWTWDTDDSESYKFELFWQPDAIWKNAEPFLTDASGLYRFTKVPLDGSEVVATGAYAPGPGTGIIGYGGGLGYLYSDIYVGWEVDRPSVTIVSKDGNALEKAETLRIRYRPIVKTDKPAPVAYVLGDDGAVIIDHTVGLVDTDPTTCQNLEETDIEKMNDAREGNVLETTLPFCADGEACAAVAETLKDYMDYAGVITYSLTCGPDSNPILGATVQGYDDNLRIDSINYSFQDGSSYTIEVSLAPVFAAVGSWSVSGAVLQTEDVERAAIIRWTAGDGTNYRVDVQGLGSFYAVNGNTGSNRLYYPGDRVTVKVFNIPKEKP